MIALFREVRPPERADYELTPHETRLLKLLVEGHNYKTAAAELGVSVNTISFHMRQHLREAPGPLQVGGRRQGAAQPDRLETDRLASFDSYLSGWRLPGARRGYT